MGRYSNLKRYATSVADLDNGNELSNGRSAPLVSASASATFTLPLTQIVVANRIRQALDPEKIESLAGSIRQHGFRGVLWVRLVEGRYHLIAGGRRYEACKRAGITEVPVEVWDVTDSEALQLELLENFQREDLNPIEEAEGVMRMLELSLEMERSQVVALLGRMSRTSKSGHSTGLSDSENNVVLTPHSSSCDGENSVVLTPHSPSSDATEQALFQQVEEIFSLIGRYSPLSFRSHRLPLLNMPPMLIEAVRSGELDYTKARALSQVKDEAELARLLEQVVAEDIPLSEVKELVSQLKQSSSPVTEPAPRQQFSTRMQELAKQFRSSKTDLDSRTLNKVGKLLAQLEELLSQGQ